MIQAVIFDFGGVLATDQAVRARLAAFDALLGWTSGTLYDRLYSGPAWEAVSKGLCTLDQFWAEVGAPLEERLPADFPRFRDNFYSEPLNPDLVRLAWRLRADYKIALLSNATILLPDRLAAEPELDGLFATVVVSALVGMRKPEPAIYDLICRRLELPPAACVIIDDKARNTNAARAHGLPAITHRDVATTVRALRNMGVATGYPK